METINTTINTTAEAVEAVDAIETYETASNNTAEEASSTAITATTTVDDVAEAEEATTDEEAGSEQAGSEGTAITLHSLNSLKYLISEIYSHSYLLNKATGMNIFIDEGVKSDLAEAVTFEEGLALFREANELREEEGQNEQTGMELIKGLELRDISLLITAFDELSNSAMKKAVRMLLTFLEKSVKEKEEKKDKNVNLHKVEIKRPENEKFALRTWLIRLGWKGTEGKMELNLLYKNLSGNTAFCTPSSKARWEEKHKKVNRNKEDATPSISAETSAEEAATSTASTEAIEEATGNTIEASTVE